MGPAPSYYDSIGLLAICDAIDAVEGIPFVPSDTSKYVQAGTRHPLSDALKTPSESLATPPSTLSGVRHADPGKFAPPQHILLAHIPVTGVLSPFGTIPYEEQTRMAMNQFASAGQLPQQPPPHTIGGARPNIPVAHNLHGASGQRSRSESTPQGVSISQGGMNAQTSGPNASSTGFSTISKPASPAAVQRPPLARTGGPSHPVQPSSPPLGTNTPPTHASALAGTMSGESRGSIPPGLPTPGAPALGLSTPSMAYGIQGADASQSESQSASQIGSPSVSSSHPPAGLGAPHGVAVGGSLGDQVSFGSGGAHSNSSAGFTGSSYDLSASSAISPGMSPGSLAGMPLSMPLNSNASGIGNMPDMGLGNIGGMPMIDSRASTPGSPMDSSQSQFRVEVCQICGRDFKGRKAATHKQQHIRRLHPAEYTPKRGGKKSRME